MKINSTNRTDIREKVHSILKGKLLEESIRYRNGSTATTYLSCLINDSGSVHVALKIWNTQFTLGRIVAEVHNNYVLLNNMTECISFAALNIPKLHYSFIELINGDILSLPTDKILSIDSVEKFNKMMVKNQLLIVDDLSCNKKYEVVDNKYPYRLPEDIIDGILSDINILTHFMDGDKHRNSRDLLEAIIVTYSPEKRYSIADIDKISPIMINGSHSFEVEIPENCF